MAEQEKTITETELAQALAEQAERYEEKIRHNDFGHRLKHIESCVHDVSSRLKDHKEKILNAVEGIGVERRQEEKAVLKRFNEMNEYNHQTFVKKTDLRMWAALIVIAVTSTVGFITWLGTQTNNETAADKIVEKIVKQLKAP